ncbi:MAG TPA: glycosyltransferase family 4 protein [Polyangia bacterium]
MTAALLTVDDGRRVIDSAPGMATSGTVLHVIETLGRGGAETALVSGLPALRTMGWVPEVFVLRPPVDLAADLRERGVAVEVGLRPLIRRLRATRGQRRVLHSHLFFANVWARLFGKAFDVPVVTTLHNPDYGSEGAGRFGVRLAIDRGLLRLKPPTYLSVSEIVRSDYRQSLGIESQLCPNPVDPFWLEPPPSKAEARGRLGLGGDPLVFACGRLHVQKGFDILARVAARFPQVRFAIAGRGPDGDKLRGLGPVELLGVLKKETIRDWVRASDVVAVPSRWESFGIFALEAMAAGAAIVATDIPGLKDTLSGAASLVPPEDESALFEGIQHLLLDVAKRDALGASAAQQARRFTVEAWAARHAEVYERLFADILLR